MVRSGGGGVRVVVYEELEVIVKMQKKLGEGGLVRVVLNEELKLLWKCQKKVGGGGSGWM